VVATLVSSVFNFFDQTLRHQTGRKEFYSSVVHSREQLFSVVIDEANIRQIND
jgi:hypothetical protein